MMKTFYLICALGAGLALTACGSSTGSNANTSSNTNTAATCFSGTPTTNTEIITACTGASVVKIDLNPTIKHLNADGSLPTPPDPLPN